MISQVKAIPPPSPLSLMIEYYGCFVESNYTPMCDQFLSVFSVPEGCRTITESQIPVTVTPDDLRAVVMPHILADEQLCTDLAARKTGIYYIVYRQEYTETKNTVRYVVTYKLY